MKPRFSLYLGCPSIHFKSASNSGTKGPRGSKVDVNIRRDSRNGFEMKRYKIKVSTLHMFRNKRAFQITHVQKCKLSVHLTQEAVKNIFL